MPRLINFFPCAGDLCEEPSFLFNNPSSMRSSWSWVENFAEFEHAVSFSFFGFWSYSWLWLSFNVLTTRGGLVRKRLGLASVKLSYIKNWPVLVFLAADSNWQIYEIWMLNKYIECNSARSCCTGVGFAHWCQFLFIVYYHEIIIILDNRLQWKHHSAVVFPSKWLWFITLTCLHASWTSAAETGLCQAWLVSWKLAGSEVQPWTPGRLYWKLHYTQVSTL